MQITKNSPATAHLIDVTRTVSRAGQTATGIDRIERAYIEQLINVETPLSGLLRTKLGYLLLNKSGCQDLVDHYTHGFWGGTDFISRLTRRNNLRLGIAETGLRRAAQDRATPRRLAAMLSRHLPDGTVYFNIGQTNLTDRVIHAVKTIPDSKIVTYIHDTIPLDWPETQTQKSHLKFKRHLDRAARHADMVLCNSTDTKNHVLRHAPEIAHAEVITPGLPEISVGTAPTGAWTGQPYFVVIGTLEPRKNIGLLLDIWDEMPKAFKPHLLICGKRGWLNEDVFLRLDNSSDRVHELNDLPDNALWALLQSSNGLLFPSRAEGFGYPAMEAAHIGVPIICTPLPVFKELLGDYPIYAETSERYLWRNKIEQLAQRRRGQSGEQKKMGGFEAPTWQAHFNRLFTLL